MRCELVGTSNTPSDSVYTTSEIANLSHENSRNHMSKQLLGRKAWINVDGIGNQSDIIKTNRIVFRSMVKPGDTLSIWATDITIS